jgi:glycosyltransferase involved in cell wall biosynthesis
MKDLTFVIPCFNAAPNLQSLLASLQMQNDATWRAIFIDDMSTDGTYEFLSNVSDDRVSVIKNDVKKFALRNIVETIRTSIKSNSIIAIIDGDDELCNKCTVQLVKEAHTQPGMVVWTGHRWDTNGMNISRSMPDVMNPYQYPWVSSHLKTFDASLLDGISDENFKDHKGMWFERGYDQALFLPLIWKSTKRFYLPEICYLYKINSCSIQDRDWSEKKQHQTVNFVRARGFIGY